MYRTVNDSLWGEPWFEELSIAAKLLFLNLLSNRRQTPCGVIEITARSLAHETGLEDDALRGAMAELWDAGKARWWPEINCIWLKRFYRWQRANSSDNYTKAAVKALQALPHPVQVSVLAEYPELGEGWYTPPQPIPNPSPTQGDKEEEEETATGKGRESLSSPAGDGPTERAVSDMGWDLDLGEPIAATGPEPAAANGAHPRARSPDWPDMTWIEEAYRETFWPLYPRKTHKQHGLDTWRSLMKRQPSYEAALALAEHILEVLNEQSAYWTDPKFTPEAGSYLNGRRWEDEIIVPTGGRAARR